MEPEAIKHLKSWKENHILESPQMYLLLELFCSISLLVLDPSERQLQNSSRIAGLLESITNDFGRNGKREKSHSSELQDRLYPNLVLVKI